MISQTFVKHLRTLAIVALGLSGFTTTASAAAVPPILSPGSLMHHLGASTLASISRPTEIRILEVVVAVLALMGLIALITLILQSGKKGLQISDRVWDPLFREKAVWAVMIIGTLSMGWKASQLLAVSNSFFAGCAIASIPSFFLVGLVPITKSRLTPPPFWIAIPTWILTFLALCPLWFTSGFSAGAARSINTPPDVYVTTWSNGSTTKRTDNTRQTVGCFILFMSLLLCFAYTFWFAPFIALFLMLPAFLRNYVFYR